MSTRDFQLLPSPTADNLYKNATLLINQFVQCRIKSTENTISISATMKWEVRNLKSSSCVVHSKKSRHIRVS